MIEHLRTKAFFEVDEFPWARQVERLYPEIRREVEALLEALDLLPSFDELQAEQASIAGPEWRVFPFMGFTTRIPWSLERFPATARALALMDSPVTAMFSLLKPGKEIPPHTGPSPLVLRYHLGVVIPTPEACGIQVNGEVRHWSEGQSLIFDDYYEHSAWNRSSGTRVVLFVDFLRPLPAEYRDLQEMLVREISESEFIAAGANNFSRWIETHGREFDRVYTAALDRRRP